MPDLGDGGSDRVLFERPLHMVWIATNGCNLRCRHCSSDSTVRGTEELTTCEARMLVDQMADAGVVDVAVSGGEPFLRSDLLDIVGCMQRRGMSVGIGTNGTTLTQERIDTLASIGIDRVQVSLDGGEAEHDALRGASGLHERALRAVCALVRAGVATHVCMTVQRLSFETMAETAQLVADLGVRRFNISRYVPTGRPSDDLDLPHGSWREVAEKTVELRLHYQGRMEVTSHLAQLALVDSKLSCSPVFIGCQAGRGQGCITADGNVLPCVLLPVSVGNIRERELKDIWADAPALHALRDRSRLHGPCRSCSRREVCGGCRAVAYALTGDLHATDPRCWVLPRSGHESARAPISVHPG